MTGHVTFRDSVWGDLTLTTRLTASPYTSSCGSVAHLLVTDGSDTVRLRRDWDWGCATISVPKPATDRSGNVFVSYNPGRYEGVIVLRAMGGRLESFGSLPADDDDQYVGTGPFGYWTETVASTRTSGLLDILQHGNYCATTCEMSGPATEERFVWSGRGYESQGRFAWDGRGFNSPVPADEAG